MKTWVVFLLAVLTALPGQVASGSKGPVIPLRSWTFHHGDELKWMRADVDDSEWAAQAAPELFKRNTEGVRGWYRARFDLPEGRPDGGWGIWLGRILTADEVYLNGTLIGGEGRVGEDFTDAPQKERVYLLPDHLLEPGVNVLAVRVQSSLAQGGLADTPRMGGWRGLSGEASRRAARQKGREAFVLGMLLMALGFWGLLYVRAARRHGYGWIGVIIALITVVFAMESLLLYEAGWLTPWGQRVAVAAMIALPVPLFMLGLPVVGPGYPALVLKGLAALCAVLALLNIFVGGLEVCGWIEKIWLLVLLAGPCVILPGLARTGWRALSAPALAVFAGFSWMVLFGLAEYLLSTHAPRLLPFSLALHLGFAGLAIALAAALSLQYHATYRQLRLLSRQLVGTEEKERKRLAATLHNDIAPVLATVKLDLQLLLRKHKQEADGQRSVADISGVIDALRDFSHALRPAAVDQLGLCVALRSLAERVADQQGFALSLDLPPDDAPLEGMSSDTAVTVYRAAQEALTNTVRHAQAESIAVALKHKNGGVLLRVADDGQGCAPHQTSSGLGLLTLRERAEAMGGTWHITTTAGKGVEILLWLPLN